MRQLLQALLLLVIAGCGGQPESEAAAEASRQEPGIPLLWDNPHPIKVEPERSREEFKKAFGRVKGGMTPAEVEKVLGKPDDIWTQKDSSDFVHEGEIWCYGSDRHLGMPTLGYVIFKDNKVWGGYGERLPSELKLPAEPELKRLLRVMSRSPKDPNMTDPLHLLRVANALIPLEKEQALDVIREHVRVSPGSWHHDNWHSWLLRVMFDVPAKGFMRVPSVGALSPAPPKDMKDSPRFPILMEDDVPLCLYQGAALGGVPEFLDMFLDRDVDKGWTLRTTPLRPPDDPFLTYKKIVASKAYTSLRRRPENEDELLKSLLLLVRTAYRTPEFDHQWPRISSADFNNHHAAFLATKPRWDERLQLYVRGDGTYTLDTYEIYPQHTYRFTSVKEIQVTVRTERRTTETVDVSIDYSETPGTTVYPTVLKTVRHDTGEVLGTACLAPDGLNVDPAEFVKRKPRKGKDQHLGTGGYFVLEKGKSLRSDLIYNGRTYRGPVITP